MGNQRQYLKNGGFSQYLYKDHKEFPTVEINGVRGKVIEDATDPKHKHYSLPTYANTSDMYFKVNEYGEVVQGRLYINRQSVLDFDWAHSHTNASDGKKFPRGTVHVQEYRIDSNGKPIRDSDNARFMTEAEIQKYGPIIHAFNPDVKFRQ